MSRRNSITSSLFAISNLCQVIMNIWLRKQNEYQRAELDYLRAQKIRQDIAGSKARQTQTEARTGIIVHRYQAQTAQDNNKVVLQDLQIEMQKLKILELQKKLGISTGNEFNPQDYDLYNYTPEGATRYEDRRK